MSNILISPPPTTLLTGLLQLDGGVAISSTPVYVTDQNNTASKLSLGTNNVGINTTSTFARFNIANNNTSTSEYLMLASTSTASFYIRNDGFLYNAEKGRISNILIANQGTNSLASTLSGSGGGCLWLGTNGTAITNTTSLTPTAMAHIKGSGSTSATTSLLVQNSSGVNSISTTDDGKSLLTANISNDAPLVVNNAYGWAGSYVARCQTWLSAGSEVARMMANGSMILQANITASTFKATQNIPSDVSFGGNGSGNGMYMPSANVTAFATSSTERMRIDSSGNVGINTASSNATANLEVRGAMTSNVLKLVNSTDTLQYFTFYQGTPPNFWDIGPVGDDGNTILRFYRNNYIVSRVGGTEYMRQESNGVGLFVGGATPTARLQVKGSGSTSATTNLLVQNSSGTQMFKITDDGVVEGGGATATQFKIMNQNGLAISRDASLDANIRIREFSGSGPVFKMNGNSGFVFKMIDGSNFPCIQSYRDWTGIGKSTTVENTSAALQVDSTTRGFLPPRMTTAEKLAIGTPASGLQVYDTSLNQMSYYNGVTWINW